jgi:hypothetical protein
MNGYKLTIKTLTLLTLITVNQVMAQTTGSCQEGYRWDGNLNRCLISVQTAETKQEVTACDGKTGDELKNCFMDLAKEKSKEQEGLGNMSAHEKDFKKGNTAKIAMPLMISLVSSYYLFMNKDKFEDCQSTSMWLLFGAGVTSFVGEASAQITFKTKTKNLEDKYKDKMKELTEGNKYEGMTQNQTLAFDYLIEAEEARMSAEKIRKNTWALSRALYAGTVLVALTESAMTGFDYGAASCKPKETRKQERETKKALKNQSAQNATQNYYDHLVLVDERFIGYSHVQDMTPSELIEIIARKIFHQLVPVAYASGLGDLHSSDLENDCYDKIATHKWNAANKSCDPIDDTKVKKEENPTVATQPNKTSGLNATSGKNGANDIVNQFANQTSKFTQHPSMKGQMNFLDEALATPWVRAALAGALGIYAHTIAEDAKDNIKISEKRIEVLKKMREEFVASGGAGFATCSRKDRDDQSKPRCFCYKDDQTLDERKSKLTACLAEFSKAELLAAQNYDLQFGDGNSGTVCVTNKNELDTLCKCKTTKTCASVSANLNLANLGANSWMSGIAIPADALLGGTLHGSRLDASDLNRRAMAIQKQTDKLGADPKYAEHFKKIKDTSLKMQNANRNAYEKNFGNSFPPSMAASFGNTGQAAPLSLADVMKEAKESLKKANSVKFSEGKDLGSEKKAGADNLNFDWGNDSQGGGVKIEEVAQVMDKNFAIKGDINNNPSQNLFQIMSMRYQRSALRRLFESEEKIQADQASESDINE